MGFLGSTTAFEDWPLGYEEYSQLLASENIFVRVQILRSRAMGKARCLCQF